MRVTLFLLPLVLAACGKSDVERAREDVGFLEEQQASNAEKCKAYGRLAEAEMEVKNANAWENAKLSRDIYCRAAKQGL